jgi:AcrR family transcriptional regulator
MLTTADERSREILSKIKTVFNQKGFDGASMQDLSRAAEMSAGNFYRYFASKDAIVASIVQQDLAEVADIFRHILAAPDPRAAFLASLRREILEHHGSCDGPLWAEIDAASNRDAAIAGITQRMEAEVMRYLLETFQRIAGRPMPEIADRFSDHARLIIVIFKGTAMRPDLTPGLVDLAVATIDGLLDQVVEMSRSTSPSQSRAG